MKLCISRLWLACLALLLLCLLDGLILVGVYFLARAFQPPPGKQETPPANEKSHKTAEYASAARTRCLEAQR